MLVTDLAELAHHVEGHRGIAALAQNGFDDDRGHTFGLRVGQEQVFQASDRVLNGDPITGRREGRAEDI